MLPCYKDTSYRMNPLLTRSAAKAWPFTGLYDSHSKCLSLHVKEISHIHGCSEASNYDFKKGKMTLDILAITLRTPILPLKHRMCFQSNMVQAVMPGEVPKKLGS